MQSLTNTEETIMNCIWEQNKDVSVADLLQYMKDTYGKNYARTTVCVFMSYLREKGYVVYHKKSHAYVYHPLISRQEYRQDRLRDLVSRCFEGSYVEMVKAIIQSNDLTPDDKAQLSALLAE